MMITPMAPAVAGPAVAPSRGAAGGCVIARMPAIVPNAHAEHNRPAAQLAPDATACAMRSPISLVE